MTPWFYLPIAIIKLMYFILMVPFSAESLDSGCNFMSCEIRSFASSLTNEKWGRSRRYSPRRTRASVLKSFPAQNGDNPPEIKIKDVYSKVATVGPTWDHHEQHNAKTPNITGGSRVATSKKNEHGVGTNYILTDITLFGANVSVFGQPLEQIKCDTSLLLGMFQVNYWELCKISWC